MSIQTVEISLPESIIKIIEIRQGPAGTGGGGTNSITSATTSDGTADLDLLNVDTVTATVSGTLTADHIHGNLAGNVYGHIRAGENLAKGDPVYVSGSHGSGSTLIPIVSKADASNAAKMPAIGIMDAAVANNANGHMVIVGTITELNTAGYTVNAELYVKAGGGMTSTPPTARAQPVARVERANANNGAVIVKVNGLSASDATANTLVRRDGMGSASFSQLATTGMVADGSIAFNGTDAIDSLAFNMVYYSYGTGAASAHRIALGGVGDSSTGTALFGAATAAAARTTLGFDAAVPKIPFTVSNSSEFTTASTSFQDVTGLSFPVKANTRYAVVCGVFTNKNDGAGLAVQFTGPASPNRVILRAAYSTSQIGTVNATVVTSLSSPWATMNSYSGDGLFNLQIGIIDIGANAGTVQLQVRAVTSGTAKILAGSSIQITEL